MNYSFSTFEEKLNTISPIKLISFSGNNNPVEWECLTRGRKYTKKTPRGLLSRKCLCSKCYIRPDFKKTLETIREGFERNNIEIIFSPTETTSKFELFCKNCETSFFKSVAKSRNNQTCPICNNKGFSLPLQEFLKRMERKYPNEFDILDATNYHGIRNSEIFIKHSCGFCFVKTPEGILKHGCPKCNKKRTKGEREISGILEKYDIPFISQYFQKINNQNHFFDFYLPRAKTIIEFDGEAHFYPIEYFGGELKFKEIRKKDFEKNNWCKENGITIIRVPYTERGNIENFLKSSTTILKRSKNFF